HIRRNGARWQRCGRTVFPDMNVEGSIRIVVVEDYQHGLALRGQVGDIVKVVHDVAMYPYRTGRHELRSMRDDVIRDVTGHGAGEAIDSQRPLTQRTAPGIGVGFKGFIGSEIPLQHGTTPISRSADDQIFYMPAQVVGEVAFPAGPLLGEIDVLVGMSVVNRVECADVTKIQVKGRTINHGTRYRVV